MCIRDRATAVAKTSRALRTKTTITGPHYYDEGDLVDYHRPTIAKDDWGGWNAPFPAVKNDPERAREIGFNTTALRTVLTSVASLSAGRPTKKGAPQMTSASRLSPKAHLALHYLTRNLFRIENVVTVRLAKSIHKLPPVTCADCCALIHYDNDVNQGFHYHEAEGIALSIHDISGSAHSTIIQCLKSTRPQAGFDQDMARFEELVDTLTPEGTAREASEAELPHDDGRLSTIHEEPEVDLESHVMEVWHAELQEERELLEATPPEDLFTIPTQM
eukprot:764628-Pyramimonas_sp.AAC.1